MDLKQFLEFSERDFSLIVEGLDALKNKDFAGEMMGMMLSSMMKPKDNATVEEKMRYQQQMDKDAAEKVVKEEKKKEFVREVDLVRSKLLIIDDMRRREDLRVNGKKLN